MEKVIHIDKLKKKFGKEEALKDVSFQVNKGEIFGLMGPSGAGKTTVIKTMIGEHIPIDGSVSVLNYTPDQFHNNTYLEQIGLLSDNSTLYERITVKDNLLLFQELYGADRKAVNEVVEKVGLSDALKKPVKNLSKGMRQRVLLCKCIMHKPAILFLDEPTSALDPATTEHIHNLLLELRNEGTTILLTTHNMEEATLLCDRVALLDEGVVKELDAPSSLRHRHKRNVVHTYYKDGIEEEIPRASDYKDQLTAMMADPEVVHFNTDLPTLGQVFKRVTGKELQ